MDDMSESVTGGQDGAALPVIQFDMEQPEGLHIPDDGIALDAVIAAILSKKHSLSAEDLAAFETLLDAPDLDAEMRQEFLQTLWNVVVSIIDYQWDASARLTAQDSCGSIAKTSSESAFAPADKVKCDNSNLSQTYRQAAYDKAAPERKT